jgi:hypothetical protein
MPICSTWRRTAVIETMGLTRVEREKITDSMLKIQSARASLDNMDETKIQDFEEIQSCLETADKNLRLALKDARLKKDY